MKVKWEAKDIKAGRRIACGSGAAEQYIIGYTVTKGEKDYCMVSLTDGLVMERKTREQLAVSLTEGSYIPYEMASPELQKVLVRVDDMARNNPNYFRAFNKAWDDYKALDPDKKGG